VPATDPPPQGLRASDLIGRPVGDVDGTVLGRIADLIVEDDRVTAVIVTKGPWGRLLGYEREAAGGPWLLQAVARAVLRRNSRRIAWPDAHLR
jgi:sporulation protein YlmC with PRC-barrel domain